MNTSSALEIIFGAPKILFDSGVFKISNLTFSLLISNLFFLFIYGTYNRINSTTVIIDKIFDLVDEMSDKILEGRKSFNNIFVFLFISIAFFNFISCLSFFPVNSLFFVPPGMAVILFFFFLVVGAYEKKHHVVTDLVPESVPSAVKLVLFPIELISVFAKPVSLSARLLLNIAIRHMVAHTLHSVASGFGFVGMIFGPVLLALVNLTEIGAGILQAYVFVMFSMMIAGVFLNKSH